MADYIFILCKAPKHVSTHVPLVPQVIWIIDCKGSPSKVTSLSPPPETFLAVLLQGLARQVSLSTTCQVQFEE